MDRIDNAADLLELLPYPAFSVAGGKILQVNEAARQRQLTPGDRVADLLHTGKTEYEAFTDGCLYLTLAVSGVPCGATVKKLGDGHLFLLDQETRQAALQAYALAARELRGPLGGLVSAAAELHSPELDRSIHQLLRLADNMTDAVRYEDGNAAGMAVLNLTALVGEIMEKSQTLAAQAGITLGYTGPGQSIYGLADDARLERAVYNLLANALKFSPTGSTVECTLRQQGSLLCFTVQDHGRGIPADRMGSVFTRYLRQPGLEDDLQGIGLGMQLIRSVAAAHGGTVLLEQPQGGGSRVTMTLTLRQDSTVVRSPIMKIDSGWDRGLVELSEVLPLSAYENI